jgi:hypothetical protein
MDITIGNMRIFPIFAARNLYQIKWNLKYIICEKTYYKLFPLQGENRKTDRRLRRAGQ